MKKFKPTGKYLPFWACGVLMGVVGLWTFCMVFFWETDKKAYKELKQETLTRKEEIEKRTTEHLNSKEEIRKRFDKLYKDLEKEGITSERP